MEEYIPSTSLKERLPYLMSQAAHSIEVTLENSFQEIGKDLKLQEFLILARLLEEPQATQGEVAEFFFMEKPLMSRIAERMERKKLIERKSDKDDRRIKRLSITKSGEKMHFEARKCALKNRHQALNNIPEEEFFTCIKVMKTIISNLSQPIPQQ